LAHLVPPSSPPRRSSDLGTALDRASTISAPDDTGRLPVLWTSVALDRPRSQIRSAELVATAHGTYEARIDGAVVTTSVLNPGWRSEEHTSELQSRFDLVC